VGDDRLPRTGRFSAACLVALVLGALAIPLGAPPPDRQDLDASLVAPCADHPLGTDLKGRDVLSRTCRGLLLSLVIGVLGTGVAATIGVGIGLVSGYVGGRTDAWLMRVVDVLYGLPFIAFVAVLTVVFGRGALQILVAIGMVSWLTMARVVRAEVRSVRARPFVEAARSLGAPHARILLRHILPNVMGPAIVSIALTVPAVIRQEAMLSFLGLGVEPPSASLGTLLREGMAALSPLDPAWWLLLVPVATLLILVLTLQGVADALRDAWDPRASGR